MFSSLMPFTLRASMSNELSSTAVDDNITCPEQPTTILEKDANSVSLVRKSKTTAVHRETTDDT